MEHWGAEKCSGFSFKFDTYLQVRVGSVCCGLDVRSPREWEVRCLALRPEQLDEWSYHLGRIRLGWRNEQEINCGNTVTEKIWKIQMEICYIWVGGSLVSPILKMLLEKKKMVQTGIRQYYYTSKKAWSLLKVGLLDSSLVPLSVPFCLNRLLCMC